MSELTLEMLEADRRINLNKCYLCKSLYEGEYCECES